MRTLANTPERIARELSDGAQVEITHAHGRTYLRIKPKGARCWCSAPVDLESAEILAGRWALMNSVERAARAAKQREG
ncbi:hypothetical protein LOK46_10725 [Methylobacterium sp. NMS14P]|uniref:hypothetical protein n=1 Tax=Methylobacterium sp. NMS14P TaxID=2894310 RepID=UPI0023594C8D|nr:hypothetical protein [Methylobacterium sp. NMS14P]WCS27264.1 hypothetical protein LOK46_10725 [Methylobacterium sp. NMS14P]